MAREHSRFKQGDKESSIPPLPFVAEVSKWHPWSGQRLQTGEQTSSATCITSCTRHRGQPTQYAFSMFCPRCIQVSTSEAVEAFATFRSGWSCGCVIVDRSERRTPRKLYGKNTGRKQKSQRSMRGGQKCVGYRDGIACAILSCLLGDCSETLKNRGGRRSAAA